MGAVRPIIDSTPTMNDAWILARSKVKYYGAYPSGFLKRARRQLVGGDPEKIIWHIPGGMAREYNGTKGGILLEGFGKMDKTIDLNPACKPDFEIDVRDLTSHFRPVAFSEYELSITGFRDSSKLELIQIERPDAIIIDRPYTLKDADHYPPGADKFPQLSKLIKDCLEIVKPGCFVGVIDYEWPQLGKNYREVFLHPVLTGRGNKIRLFSGWEKLR